jgi:hypothetical protein
MTIPTAWIADALPPLNANVPIVDVKTGLPTAEFLLAWQRLSGYINAGSRVIPCSASTTSNVITLTPNNASPRLTGYRDYDIFAFVADAGSTGSVTATVVPAKGALPTLKVYKSDGASQAGNADIVSGSLYLLVVADAFDSGNGGFILK